jgi:hypothetical protein
MATYEVQAPDGSILELEGPDNATPEQIGAAAKRAYAAQAKTPRAAAPAAAPPTKFEQARESYTKYGGGPAAPVGIEPTYATPRAGTPTGLPEGAGQVVEPETTLAGIGGAISRGIAPAAVLAGAGALAAPLVGVAAPVGAALGGGALLASKVLGVDQPFVEKLNELMTRAGVAEPTTAIERLFQSAAGSAADVATGVGAGQALMKSAAPVAQAAGAMLAEQPATQLAGGVGSGLAAQAASELGLGAAGQAAAALIGGMAGSRAARTQVIPAAQASAAERALVTEAEKAGIPLMTSDVAPPRTFVGKAAQSLGERVPVVGTGPVRQAQQEARISAVRDVLNDFGASSAAQASDAVMADLQATRGGSLSKYASQKTDVINRLSQAGTVPVPGAIAAIDQQISKLTGLKTKEVRPVIERLEDWKQSIQGQNLTNIEDLRKQLGEAFKAPELASVRSTGEKALSSIYGALRDDMGAFIRDNGQPQDVAKWTDANKKLASMAGELKTGALKSALEKGTETPEAIRGILFSSKPSDVRLLYRNLSDAGRENAKAALLAHAAEKATTNDVLSVERFVSQVDKLGPQFGVFFKGDDKRRIEGLTRVLGATRRAAEAGVMTNTGQQAVPAVTALAAGQVSGSALGGAAALGGAGLMARLYESPMVRNLLLRIPSTKVGSPEEAAILKRISGAMTARTTTPEEQPTP